MLVAHKNQMTDQIQSLEDHLLNTAYRCAEIGKGLQLEHLCFLLGLLHDIGKRREAFQSKIQKNTKDSVIHSSEGARVFIALCLQELKETVKDRMALRTFSEVVAYVISAHHGIYDIPKRGDDNHLTSALSIRMSREENPNQETFNLLSGIYQKQDMLKDCDLSTCVRTSFAEFEHLLSNLRELAKRFSPLAFDEAVDYYVGMTVRLLLSILKRADVFDTINAFEEVIPLSRTASSLFEFYRNRVEEKYAGFPEPSSPINKVRTYISQEARHNGRVFPSGIYKFNVPTGAGKTLSSLAYATEQLTKQGKTGIFYITAFLSVLEQNASEIWSILGDKGILEHHSNVVEEKNINDETISESVENTRASYLLDTWDSPVVLTTMVQFFNTLLKDRSANIMRFSTLANHVLIIDEVQSLPIEVTHLFNLSMNFLAYVMHCNIVLCTATQPLYNADSVVHRMGYREEIEEGQLVSLSEKQRAVFKRVRVSKLEEEETFSTLDELVSYVQGQSNKSRLVILNTKRAARTLFDRLKETNSSDVYYLSTDLCAAHRRNRIEEINRKLSNREPILCISTQLIEAGVDVDFDVVVRSFAGIDSIVQAAGRCNREGKLDHGEMKLVALSDSVENLQHLPSIQNKQQITTEILFGQRGEIVIDELNDSFFRKYFANHAKEMSYPRPHDEPNLLNLLSTGNDVELKKYCVRQSFKTAGMEFQLIDESGKSVIVYYRESENLIEELINQVHEYEKNYDAHHFRRILRLIRKLQPYTVQMHEREFKNQKAVMGILEDRIWILSRSYYNERYGKSTPDDTPLLML